MDRKSNLEVEGLKPSIQCNNDLNSFDANDDITRQRRQRLKEQLKNNCEPNQNIDDLLTSLECYCLLILQSLK
jgi:hypothetical protein